MSVQGSRYWECDCEQQSKIFCSYGAFWRRIDLVWIYFRALLKTAISDVKCVIFSVSSRPWLGLLLGIEFKNSHYCFHKSCQHILCLLYCYFQNSLFFFQNSLFPKFFSAPGFIIQYIIFIVLILWYFPQKNQLL